MDSAQVLGVELRTDTDWFTFRLGYCRLLGRWQWLSGTLRCV